MKPGLLLKRACAVAAILSCSQFSFAQLSGAVTVGSGQTYTSLTGSGGLFSAINSQGISGDVTAIIVSDLTEDGTVTLSDFTSGGTNSVHLTIAPDGTTERLISGTVTTGMIAFSGVRNLKIDGSFSGDNIAHLRFRNISTGASAQTMKFALGSTTDTVTYCFIEGSNNTTSSTAAGAVLMIDATTTGNNNLVFKNNKFSNPSNATNNTTMPSYLLKSLSSNVTADNSNITVDSNEFLNASVVGIQLGTSGATNADNWNITNNAIYDSLTSPSSTATRAGIYIQKGNGHLISNNKIGGSNALMGGNALVANAIFYGIYQGPNSSSSTSRVNIINNEISNISGIGSSSSYNIYGIYALGNYSNILNNKIGLAGPLTSNQIPIAGISFGASTNTARDSVVGNTVKHLTATLVATSTSLANAVGIYSQGGNHYIADNTIDSIVGNTTSNGAATAPTGILIGATLTTSGVNYYVQNNRITNVINTNTSTLSGYGAAVVGICINTSTSSQPIKVFGNYIADVYGKNTTTAGGNNVMGIIENSGAGGNDSFVNNVIIMGNGDRVANPSWVRGVHIASGAGTNTFTFINNTIYMSSEMTLNAPNVSNKGGAACISVLNNPSVRLYNNILVNAATNAGTGNMPAYYHMPSTLTTLVSDYNLYSTTNAANLNCINGTYSNLATWKTNLNIDKNSTNAPVAFTSNTDMHIVASNTNAWNVFGRGMAFGAVATDADNNARSTTAGIPTTVGAYEIATPSTTPVAMTMTPATPVSGTPTVFSSNGRKIAEINWDAAATLPTSINATFYPGIAAPGSPYSSNVNSYMDIQQTGFAGNYTIKLYTNDAESNGIAYASMGAIKKHDGDVNYTTIANAGSNNADVDGNYILSNALTDFSIFGLTNPSTPLPITWDNVTASLNHNQQAVVSWSVSEKEIAGYTIQKSEDGEKFNTLATVSSKGDGNNSYSYTEPSVLSGKAWYRIAQTSKNDEVSYSKGMMLQNNATSNSINIYPNPATQVLNIEVTQSGISYSIYDLQGKTVIAGTLQSGKNSLNVSDFVKGFYTIKIGDTIQKFVLN